MKPSFKVEHFYRIVFNNNFTTLKDYFQSKIPKITQPKLVVNTKTNILTVPEPEKKTIYNSKKYIHHLTELKNIRNDNTVGINPVHTRI